MKKGIAAISFLIYFAASTGIVINSHYCMKQLVSVHFFETEAETCGLCGMDMHDNSGCCKDEVTVARLVQDQVQIPVTLFELLSPDPGGSIISEFIAAPVVNINVQRHFYNHSPPLLSAQDTYLQNNVFRI